MRWSGENEHGFATWQETSFIALLASNEDDLGAAVAAIGNNLDAAISPTQSVPELQTDEQ
ncbi:MAG: hypothetical protein GQ526_00895 [Ardenticatenales bacterium]|nr:hypothetical protein [Ardenticatenales bacterium]